MTLTEKRLDYHRKWRTENREKVNSYARKWRAKNREKVRESNKKNYDPEYNKLWARTHRESRRKSEEKWRTKNYERNRVITRRANRKYRLENSEKMRMKSHRRRERIRNTKSCDKMETNMLSQLISDAPRLKCGICSKNMQKSDRTIDHVIPLYRGGSGEIWNLRVVHLLCNLKKASKLPMELKL